MRFVHLKDRSLISISGEDTFSFLQGIVTNDIEVLWAGEPCYSAILSPQGKIICDFTLILDQNRILLDCHVISEKELVQRLSRYKLRSDVAITPINHMSVCCILQLDPDCKIDFENTSLFSDPRHPALGQRLIHRAIYSFSSRKIHKLTAVAILKIINQKNHDTNKLPRQITSPLFFTAVNQSQFIHQGTILALTCPTGHNLQITQQGIKS